MNSKEIIIERVRELKTVKELNLWTSDLQDFFDVYRNNKDIILILDAIHEKKKSEYIAYFDLYERCLKEANEFIQKLKKLSKSNNHLDFPVFKFERSQRVEELENPFTSPEEELDEMLRVLKEFIFTYLHGAEGNGKSFQVAETEIIAKYIDTSTRICPKRIVVNHEENGNYTRQDGPSRVYNAVFAYDFRSRLLNECLLKRRLLMERKKCSIWGKLDHIFQWMEWTKGGIHPNNYELQNRHFNYSNLPGAIKSVGTYFIDALVSQDDSKRHTMPTLSTLNIQTLTLFPYRKSELDGFDVWLVATDYTGSNHSFYIKRTDSPSEGFNLLQRLNDIEAGAKVNFEELSHARGELSLKKEIGKVFFSKHGKERVVFNGFHQFLNVLGEKIDSVKLDKQLHLLNKQQNIPEIPIELFQQFVQKHAVLV